MPHEETIPKLTKKDFETSQEPRWCPGCGDYSILTQVRKVLPQLGIPKENIVFVAGIGCSSRFPYYVDTYGIHTIHGRALPIASGIKLNNPQLSVWVTTGDGDGLSIGGNHLIHLLRRNIDLNIILFNNRIYGLTKGQYSPTSETGKITRSTPNGSIDRPINPLEIALAAGATFVASTLDRDPVHMIEILKRAAAHKGTSFVEVYQNCNIFNDGAFFHLTEKGQKEENVVFMDHNQPLLFGKNKDKSLQVEGTNVKIVESENIQRTVYDEKNLILATIMAGIAYNDDLPTPIGVFRDVEAVTYEEELQKQIEIEIRKSGRGSLKDLLYSGDVWHVD